MNRQIIFRGKRLDNGEWVYGDLEYNRAKNIARIHTYDEAGEYFMQHLVEPDSVGQFTGLLDRNGKQIYEGDIVKFHFMTSRSYTTELFPTEKFFGEITVNKYNQWVILSDGLEIHIENAVKYGEIIGNRFDNPDLLNGK